MRTITKRVSNTYYTSMSGTLGSYLNDISKYKVLSDKEIRKEISKAKKGDQEAITKIVNSNQRFVYAVAKRFSKGDNDLLSDLINEANLGLINSIKHFDLKKETVFLTYAVYWMQRQIFLYLTFINPIVKVSNKAKTTKVAEIRNKFFLLNGRNPTSEEIIDELKTKYNIDITQESDVYSMSASSINDSSLTHDYDDFSSYFSSTSNNNSSENITSNNTYEHEIETDYAKTLISNSIGILNERETNVIQMLFGIDKYRSYEIQEVAEKLGITNEAVRLINKRAIKKLKDEIKIKEHSI